MESRAEVKPPIPLKFDELTGEEGPEAMLTSECSNLAFFRAGSGIDRLSCSESCLFCDFSLSSSRAKGRQGIMGGRVSPLAIRVVRNVLYEKTSNRMSSAKRMMSLKNESVPLVGAERSSDSIWKRSLLKHISYFETTKHNYTVCRV